MRPLIAFGDYLFGVDSLTDIITYFRKSKNKPWLNPWKIAEGISIVAVRYLPLYFEYSALNTAFSNFSDNYDAVINDLLIGEIFRGLDWIGRREIKKIAVEKVLPLERILDDAKKIVDIHELGLERNIGRVQDYLDGIYSLIKSGFYNAAGELYNETKHKIEPDMKILQAKIDGATLPPQE